MAEQAFMDEARIFVRGGDGGNGVVAFRREPYVPRGGPNGGNGGRGGNVYLRVDPQLNTLSPFRGRVHFRADRGSHGSGNNQQGRRGDDLYVPVPRGTVVRDAESGEVLGDLTEPEQTLLVADGGRGGRGNASFRTSTNQAPRVSENGETGQERWLQLELKLIADVGLVGLPNAGKSTLLSVISRARPRIADYPFTTLTPNLGVVEEEGMPPFVAADIPGLIEGAHEGRGLGDQFLRHIERTRLLVHLVDGSGAEPLKDFDAINEELGRFNEKLAGRPQLVVITKLDLPDSRAAAPALRAALEARGHEVMEISAVTRDGVRPLIARVATLVAELPEAEPVIEESRTYRPLEDEQQVTIEAAGPERWRVSGQAIERIIQMANLDQVETVQRLQRQFSAMGLTDRLERMGALPGDTVEIGDQEFEWM